MQTNTIGRKRKKNGFTQISNSMLEDSRLSWRAKGLLSYMLSRPNNWKINKKDLLNKASEGRDAVQSVLNELKEYKYLHIYPAQREGGNLTGWVWEYDDEPFIPDILKNRTTEKQPKNADNVLELRSTVSQSFGNSVVRESSTYNNTDFNNTNLNNTKDKEIKKNNLDSRGGLEKEFETLWKLYPKKDGKKDAKRHYIRARKNKIPYETIENGLYRYIDYLKSHGTESRFILNGSSWFNQERWNDELIILTAPETKKQTFLDLYKSEFGVDNNELSRNSTVIDQYPSYLPESVERA